MNALDVANGYKQMLKMMGFKWFGANQTASDKGIRKLSRELAVSHKKVLTYLHLLDEPSYVLESIEKKGVKISPFEEARTVPEKYREDIKRAIAEGKPKTQTRFERKR